MAISRAVNATLLSKQGRDIPSNLMSLKTLQDPDAKNIILLLLLESKLIVCYSV